MNELSQVCVYCASSPQVDEMYFEAASRLADHFVEHDIRLIYGGGARGLMGRIADRMLEKKGRVIGVIPEFMDDIELGHKGVELEIVPDMHTRKKRFFEGTHALVTLPGGCGTFEELLEAITWKRLGLLTCPIIIVNTGGYYDPLLEMLDRAVEQKFMGEKHREMWTAVSEPEEVVAAIKAAPAWSEDHLKYAVMDAKLKDAL